MLRVAICDDEREMIDILTAYVRRAQQEMNIDIHIDEYSESCKLCDRLESHKSLYDLIILDIIMPVKTGIDVGYLIRNILHDNQTQIAYVSSKSKFAMELFNVQPINFFIKPVIYEDVKKVLELTAQIVDINRHLFIYVKGKGNYCKKVVGDIMYFEIDGRKLIMHTVDGSEEFYGKINGVYDELKAYGFVIIHKSYLVNYRYVDKVYAEYLIMVNGAKLPISRGKKEDLKRLWNITI